MKKEFLLILSVLLCGCFYSEYESLHSAQPGQWAYDFEYQNLEKINDKVLSIDFRRRHKNILFFYLRVYSESLNDKLFITRFKVTGKGYEKEFPQNKEIIVNESVHTYDFNLLKSNEKVFLPIYQGFVVSPQMSEMKLLQAAEGKMTIEVFYLDEITKEEKSTTFEIIKETYKSWVMPT